MKNCCPLFNTPSSHIWWKHTLQWRHNERDGVSNHQPHDCFSTVYSRRRSKKTSKLRVTGLCEGNSPDTSKFPSQRASNADNASIWWRHHVKFVPDIHHVMRMWPLFFPRANFWQIAETAKFLMWCTEYVGQSVRLSVLPLGESSSHKNFSRRQNTTECIS